MNYQQKYEQLLAEFEQYKKESVKWSVEDFLDHEQDEYVISKEQAQEALEKMIHDHDCGYGITWDTVEYYISEFGTPINDNNE